MCRYNSCWLADKLLCFKNCFDFDLNMHPKMTRKNVREIEVPTKTTTKFE